MRSSLTSARVDLDDRRRQPVDRPRGADPDIARARHAPPPWPPARSRPASCPASAWTSPRSYLWPPGSSGGSSGGAISCHSRLGLDADVGRAPRGRICASPDEAGARASARRTSPSGRTIGTALSSAPRVAVDAARQVAGDARRPPHAASSRTTGLHRIVEAALEAGPEQRIDQQRRRLSCPGDSVSTSPSHWPRAHFAASLLGSASAATRTSTPRACKMPRRDIAVAAVVARSAQDQRRQSVRQSDKPLRRALRPARSISCSTLVPPSIAAASAARIASAVRIGRGHRPRLSAGWSPGATIRAGPRRRRCRALASLSNKAKQVAPEPDIRDEARARPRAEPGEHGLDLRRQRDRRRLEIVAALAPIAERPVVDAVPTGEHVRGRQRHARVDQQHRRPGQFGQIDGRQLVARALARARSCSAGRQARRFRASARLLGHASGRCPTRTSAAAAPPRHPPSRRRCPTRPASCLSSVIAAPLSTPRGLGQRARRAKHQIVVVAGKVARERARDLERDLVRNLRALSRSPSMQKAKIVSIAWRPSGSLPRT